MTPNRIGAKLFFDRPASPDVAAFIPVFHDWIRKGRVPGVPIDVANYSHVKDGPGLLLVAHAGDYVLDFAGDRAGLRYVHKRDWPGNSLVERLHTTLQGLLLGARLLQEEKGWQEAVRFRTDELQLTFPDRLNVPNTLQTFQAIQGDVRDVLLTFFGAGDVQLSRPLQDERFMLAVDARAPVTPALEYLQSRQPAVASRPSAPRAQTGPERAEMQRK